ncbi:MAG: outer membrane beta-barrel protein [Tannerellaceae bacterium]|jgi:hypothetical protein|nr:outer membrane beta-barrel protein [Tannerellaceae bacterium]
MVAGRLLLFICIAFPCCVKAQEILIPEDSATFHGLFRQIEAQTPYTVAYSHAILDPEKKISIPFSFRNIHVEDALSSLFGETPYSYTINGNHIIILPVDKNRRDLRREGSYPERERPFFFTGMVLNRKSKEILEYATVCLLDANNRILSAGITGETGEFRLTTAESPRKIRISFIGYETLEKEVNEVNEHLGSFGMDAAEVYLEEITVTGKSLPSKIDRRTYPVTPHMREGTFHAIDLLDKIQGIQYDPSTQTLKVNHQTNILLLLDGIQQSAVYIKNLSPEQIRAIEVIREPSGRFISEGYEVIVNLIPEKQAKGYDVFVSDISMVNMAGSNGKEWLAEEQPVAGISYMNRRTVVYAAGLYNREKWNMPMKRELVYDGVRVPFVDNPNDAYQSQSLHLAAGMDYRINNHLLAIQGDYAAGTMYSEYMYTTEGNVLSNISNRTLKNTAKNLTINRIATGRVSYRGKINNRLQLNSDFSCNYYYNDMDNRYRLSADNQTDYTDENVYDEYKTHTVFNLDASYLLPSGASADMGYSNSWRKYASQSSRGKGFFDYDEYRHIIFAYLSSVLSDQINMMSGLGVETVKIRNRNSINNVTYILPRLSIHYKPSPALSMEMNYTATPRYPVMYQISPMSVKVDNYLTQTGNPNLMPSLRHTASLRFGWKDKLTIEPVFHFTYNGFSESYQKNDYKLYRTFRNIHTREYAVNGWYDQAIGRYIRLSGNLTFYHGVAAGEGIENAVTGWLAAAEAGYYHPRHHFGMRFGFYRNMKKNALWQGYQMLNKDNWLLELNKIFPHTGLSVTLSYIPPLSYGIRKEQTKQMDTPLYSEATRIRLDAYYNLLLLKINFRFHTQRR